MTEQTHHPKWYFRTKALSRDEVLALYPSGTQEPITPKITPQAPRFSPHHLLPRYAFAGMDEIRADYVRMAAQWQAEWQREYEAAIVRALTSGQPAIFGVDYAGSYTDINLKVET